MWSVKKFSESQDLKSLPSDYAQFKNLPRPDEAAAGVIVPVIDVSLLSSTSPDVRARAVRDLGKACEEWGFFMVVNHGISETETDALLNVCDEFFNLGDEEKHEFEIKNPRFPVMVRSTIGANPAAEKMLFWRDYMRFFVHPQLCCPDKPIQLRSLVLEYGEKIRGLLRRVLEGVSESLGLEQDYIDKAMDLGSSTQIVNVNYYPPCPDPESAIGIPPHTDPGLLTFVIHNGVAGLEIQHDGKWSQVSTIPGAIFVNTADHLEILSNGKYQSGLHRAAVNNSKKRISFVVASGPSPDTVVQPAAPLLRDDAPARYAAMSYMEYVEAQRATRPPQKPLLERIKLYKK